MNRIMTYDEYVLNEGLLLKLKNAFTLKNQKVSKVLYDFFNSPDILKQDKDILSKYGILILKDGSVTISKDFKEYFVVVVNAISKDKVEKFDKQFTKMLSFIDKGDTEEFVDMFYHMAQFLKSKEITTILAEKIKAG